MGQPTGSFSTDRRAIGDGSPPNDPSATLVGEVIGEILLGAKVEVSHVLEVDSGSSGTSSVQSSGAGEPSTQPGKQMAAEASTAPKQILACATGQGPPGWQLMIRIRMGGQRIPDSGRGGSLLREMLHNLPDAGIRTAAEFRDAALTMTETSAGLPALKRAIRDTVAAQVLSDLMNLKFDRSLRPGLIAETIDYLIELGGSRVESNDLTHGVVITAAFGDVPRLNFDYPSDVRSAKRGPLLFDGYRSILLVDADGRARTEFQRHRADKAGSTGSGPTSLAALATHQLGGLGLVLEADRTIRAFIDGEPLLVRRGEHWTSFPLELASVIGAMIRVDASADLVVETALAISSGRHGAIIAVVEDAGKLDGIVPLKDRYDLRNEIDPLAMRVETRLHHLIDAEPLDVPTLARLAMLDGATIVDRQGRLISYGAIVASRDSQNEGARTAAAKTLSTKADIVLRVSSDGDITIFRSGFAVTTLLGNPNQSDDGVIAGITSTENRRTSAG